MSRAAPEPGHDDLGEPGHTVLKPLDRDRGGKLAGTGIDARDIDGEEAAAADQAGEGENHQGDCQHEDRGEALLDLQPPEDQRHRRSAEEAEDEPDPHLLDEQPQQVQGKAVTSALRNEFHQGDRQEDGHRIVGAGLDFQRGPDTVADIDAADAQQEEDGGRVGGGQDRAEKQTFQIAEAEEQMGGDAEQKGRQKHSDR